jgi:hypothetical protein
MGFKTAGNAFLIRYGEQLFKEATLIRWVATSISSRACFTDTKY